MKMKITRYFAILAAVAGLSSACQEELEHVVYNPEDVVAPVLNAVEDINITVDELSTGNVKFTWEQADFGVPTQIYYTLDMSADVNGETKTVNLFKNASGTEGSASYEKINGHLLYDFEFEAGVEGEVSFTLYAGFKVGTTYASNVVKAKAVAAVAERTYPTVWVIGNYCGWDHSKTQFLYDFAGDDDVYSGLVDFADLASTGFKLTGIAGWDDTCNWGEETKATKADEPAKIQLITGSSSQDIMRYAKRFYGFSFSKSTLELVKNYSFDKVGIIGLNNDWENDVLMDFNPAAQKQVFYADIKVTEATSFKFRMDGAWDLNYGGDMKALSVNGDNIAVEPGEYRVYLNMNNPKAVTCSLDTRMYGKEEGGAATPPSEEPEPTPELKGWGVVGTITGWEEGADLMMTSDGTWHVVKGVEFGAEDKFKIRLDGKWDTSFGGEFKANEEVTLTSENGPDIVPAAGTYDIYFNPDNGKAWFINDGTYPGGGTAPVESEWGLIGSLVACNNWANNVKLYVDGDYSVAKGVVFAANDEFKFRKGEAWGTELTYEGTITVDAKLDLIDGAGGKGNSKITEGGTYDVYLANDLSAYYVMTPGRTPADAGEAVITYIDASAIVVGFSGAFAGVEKWIDPADDRLATFVSKEVTDETTYAGKYTYEVAALAIAENDQFKVRINGEWIGAAGATIEGLNVTGSDNFVAGETGTYKITITFAWDGLKASDVKAVFVK